MCRVFFPLLASNGNFTDNRNECNVHRAIRQWKWKAMGNNMNIVACAFDGCAERMFIHGNFITSNNSLCIQRWFSLRLLPFPRISDSYLTLSRISFHLPYLLSFRSSMPFSQAPFQRSAQVFVRHRYAHFVETIAKSSHGQQVWWRFGFVVMTMFSTLITMPCLYSLFAVCCCFWCFAFISPINMRIFEQTPRRICQMETQYISKIILLWSILFFTFASDFCIMSIIFSKPSILDTWQMELCVCATNKMEYGITQTVCTTFRCFK